MHGTRRRTRNWLFAAMGLVATASGFVPGAARAQRIDNEIAVFAALDKVTARISRLEIGLGQTVRFGSLVYSVATVIGVLFNVSVCLGALAMSKLVAETAIGPALMMHDFRIDLNVVAALLIVIGYSLNDTIVILDRVRENRGKLPFATRPIINDSINQTFSRTVLTGGCTAATPIVLYAMGGSMMQPFAYTFLIGLIAGTFSSVAIAAPLVFVPGDGSPEPAEGPASNLAKGGTAAAV